MLRVILAALVPILAIGLTGLMVTTIGRLLLAVGHDAATPLALVLTILIMVGCTAVAARSPRSDGAARH